MTEDYGIVLPTKTEQYSNEKTDDLSLEQIESTFEAVRKTSDDRAARSDDYGLDTGSNDFGYDSGSDDLWGI